MTALNSTGRKSRSKAGLACGLVFGFGLLLVAAVGALLAWRGLLPRENATVWIDSPATEQEATVDEPVQVLAGASNRLGVSRVELYADGALVLAQDATAQGETALNLMGSWTPLTPGRHVLMARGYGMHQNFSDSGMVFVNVAEAPDTIIIDVDSLPREEGASNPSLDVVAQYLNTSADDLRGRNPDLGGVRGGDPLPAGSRVEAPRPPRVPSPPVPTPPPPPGAPAPPTSLTGSADCTTVSLVWSPSADAQTYRVYRFVDTSTTRARVADGLRGTNLRDTLPGPGRYGYQVAAVRDGSEGATPVVYVSTPAGCAPPAAPPGTATDLVLTVAMVQTTEVWDGLFCYLTVNGRPDEHLPPGDFSFFAPVTGSPNYYNLMRTPSLGRIWLTSHPVSSPVTLGRECLGRRGPRSESLGTFSASHPQSDWTGELRTVSASGFQFSYCLGPSSVPCNPPIPGVREAGFVLDVPIMLFYLPAPTNVRRLVSVEACMDLPTRTEQIDCAGASGVTGLQTIFWDWTGTALVPESSLVGYTVFRTTINAATGERGATITWDVSRRPDGTLPKRTLSQETDLACGQRVEYQVRANQAMSYSALSDPLTFETRPCVAAAEVTVSFNTLRIGYVEDLGEEYFLFTPSSDDDLEVVGNINARGGSMPSTQSYLPGAPRLAFHEGVHSWSLLDMYYGIGYTRGPAGRGHADFRTRMTNNRDDIVIGFWLSEIDTAWTGHGIIRQVPWCVNQLTLPARSVEDWSRLHQLYPMTGGSVEADCEITVWVTGRPVP